MAKKATLINKGRQLVLLPEHPRSSAWGYVHASILLAESALGGPLPEGAVVHHHNGNPLDDSHKNLVICENRGYHNYIHARARAHYATGDANKRKCGLCNEWKTIEELVQSTNKKNYCRNFCKECEKERDRVRKKKRYVFAKSERFANG